MKPVTVVEVQEPARADGPYVVTVDLGDADKSAVVWPKFCARCLRPFEERVPIQRAGGHLGGGMRLRRVVRTKVPYCASCKPRTSLRDLSFYWTLLGGACIALAVGVILFFSDAFGADWQYYGLFLGLLSSGFLVYAVVQLVRAMTPMEAVSMSLEKNGSEITFLFKNPEYGRMFGEANPGLGPVGAESSDRIHRADDLKAEGSGQMVPESAPPAEAVSAEHSAEVVPPPPAPPKAAESSEKQLRETINLGPGSSAQAESGFRGRPTEPRDTVGFPVPSTGEDTSPSLPDFIVPEEVLDGGRDTVFDGVGLQQVDDADIVEVDEEEGRQNLPPPPAEAGYPPPPDGVGAAGDPAYPPPPTDIPPPPRDGGYPPPPNDAAYPPSSKQTDHSPATGPAIQTPGEPQRQPEFENSGQRLVYYKRRDKGGHKK